MQEKQLQEVLRQACLYTGWLYFHPWTSRHSPAGFPDICALKGGRLLFAELKRPGKQPTAPQAQWLAGLAQRPVVESYLWTPADLDTAVQILQQQ